MKRLRLSLLALAGFIIAVGGGFWLATSWQMQAASIQSDMRQYQNQIDSLKNELSTLRRQQLGDNMAIMVTDTNNPIFNAGQPLAQSIDIREIKRDIAELQALVTQPSEGAVVQLMPENQETILQEQKRTVERRFAQFNDYLQSQETDNEWSSIASTLISDEINASIQTRPEAATTLNNLECRSTLCVLDIEHANLDAQNRFQMDLMVKLPQQFSGSRLKTIPKPHGRIRTVTYLVKKGEDFPAVN